MMIKKALFLVIMILSWVSLSAQESDCKVLLPRLSGSYKGECRKGLAHGVGVAQGTDRYEGEFRKGVPNGRGAYRWSDGTFYEGYYKQGLREGSGKMTYRADSVITGFWKADRYVGKHHVKKYEVLKSRFIARSSFIKTSNSPNQIKVKLTMGGAPNNSVQDFSMTYSSGDEFNPGNAYGIQNITYPVTVRLTYRTWNAFRTVMTDCTFEFRINEPGSWDVNVQN